MVVVLGLLLFITCADPVAAEDIEGSSNLIRSGAEINYPPFSMVDENGEAGGFSVELMRAALAAMGREATFRTGPWAEVRGWLERGEIDALPLVGRTPEREALFDFTVPYMSLHGAIVVRKEESGIRDLADLRGRRVAVMKGDNAEEFLRRGERGIDIHTTPTFAVALRELAEGRHDAVVIQRLVALRLIQKTGLTDLRVIDLSTEGFKQDFCFAVREGDRDTLALLNEGLAIVVADGTYRRLHAKWFAAMQLPSDRPIVVGGDRSFPPYEFIDENGRPAGYNVDLTRAIAREMGLNVEIRLGRWPERIDALKAGTIDVMQGMFYSPGRDLHFDFTPAHTVSHYVAVVRKGEGSAPETVEALEEKRIVVASGDIMHDFIIEHGLENQTTVVADPEEALRGLAEGEHDCVLSPRVTAFFLMEKYGWSHLVPAQKPLLAPEYCYAAAKGQKALLAQFSEGLKTLENSGEYRKIHDKWLGVYQETPASLITALRYSALVIIPLLAVLAAALAWTWALRRQVAEKTRVVRASEEYQRAMIACSPVALYTIDPEGNVLSWNRSAERIFGWRAEEIIGNPLPMVPEDKRGEFDALRKQILAEGGFFGKELMRLKKDGALFPVSLSVAPVRNDCGEIVGILGSAEDITERKTREKQLRESESRFRMFAELAPVGIVISNEREQTLYANPRFTEIFGYTLEDMSSVEQWWGLAYPDEALRNRIREKWRKAAEEARRNHSEIKPMEYPVTCKDGGVRHIEFRMAATGNLKVVVFTDISERKNAEAEHEKLHAQLLQAQKMESVGRLAGGVAHDYNNMLSLIIGYAELALDKTGPDDPLREDLNEILSAAMRSADITRQLLAFARKQTIRPKVIDLNETVEGMLKMLRRLIGEDIDLSWRPGPGRMPVFMDPSQVDQLLANLCVNARDAIGGVGKITIETGRIRFDAEYCADHAGFIPGEFILLAVSDDGCGMDQATLDNIFEPFFTTKGVGEGTGLGLSTVYGLVKQNQGFLNVYSEPGKGATFKIYLPPHAKAKDEEPAKAPESTETPVGRGETVLVVEDETPILHLVQRVLERLEYHVLAAATPAMALALAEEHAGAIDLLITDVVMPEMNGRKLAETLLAYYPDLKVLFMSGYTANVIAHRGVLEEGVHFIQKPVSNRDLAVKVREALKD
ncbi:MAG: transporter substrate-binding domain-containing protein [Thermodesulfobacteriota bacterium]